MPHRVLIMDDSSLMRQMNLLFPNGGDSIITEDFLQRCNMMLKNPQAEPSTSLLMEAILACMKMERDLKAAEETINRLIHYDGLTGLPNREYAPVYIQEAVDRAREDGLNGALLFIGLDHFRLVNESFGSEAGDQLLMNVARKLKKPGSDHARAVRMGGDMFAYLFTYRIEAEIGEKISQLYDGLNGSYRFAGQDIYMGASVGVSLYPQHSDQAGCLLKAAEMAMYAAKQQQGYKVKQYCPALNERLSRRMEIEAHLRKAVELKQFSLNYQPIVDMSRMRPVGMESLIRWNHPKLGAVPPGEFIPVAEETGLIIPIGNWVLEEACRQNKQWQNEGLPPIVMSVNLSSRQFYEPQFPAMLTELLQSTGLDPQWMELEITEGIMMDIHLALPILSQIRELGVSLSIDDFGTGYSSLKYLKELPVHKLKIDQSFIKQIDTNEVNRSIVQSVLSMSGQLGLQVVAEGVERMEELELLRQCGCPFAQGYWFSRPVEAAAAAAMLEQADGQYGSIFHNKARGSVNS